MSRGTLWKSEADYRLLGILFLKAANKVYRIRKCTNYIKNSIKILKTQHYNLAIYVLPY